MYHTSCYFVFLLSCIVIVTSLYPGDKFPAYIGEKEEHTFEVLQETRTAGFGTYYDVETKLQMMLRVVCNDEYKETLDNEYTILRTLMGHPKHRDVGLPKAIAKLEEVEDGEYVGKGILMGHLPGTQLNQLGYQNRKFSVDEILALGLDLVNILEVLSDCGVTHLELNPTNLMYTNPSSKSGLVLHCFYTAYLTGTEIKNKKFWGSILYSSPNVVVGKVPNPKDDLRNLIYLLASGIIELPWAQKLKNRQMDEKKVEEIRSKKIAFEDALENQEGIDQALIDVMVALRKEATSPEATNFNALREAFGKVMSRASIS